MQFCPKNNGSHIPSDGAAGGGAGDGAGGGVAGGGAVGDTPLPGFVDSY